MDGAAGTAAQAQPKTGAAGGLVSAASEGKSEPNGVQTLNGGSVLLNCHMAGGASVDTGGGSAQPAASVNNGPVSGPSAAAASVTSIIRTASQNNVASSQQTVPTVTLVRPPGPAPSSILPASLAVSVSSSSGSIPNKVDCPKPIIQTVASVATATITSPTVLQTLRTPVPSTIGISSGGGVRALGQPMMVPRVTQPQQTTTNVQNIQLPPGNQPLHLSEAADFSRSLLLSHVELLLC